VDAVVLRCVTYTKGRTEWVIVALLLLLSPLLPQ
jgi:hypothetical protein